MKLWVANTDPDWFDFLASESNIDEVNFWQPNAQNKFGAIEPGGLFLFKLKAPRNAIGGYGIFSQSSNLPVSLAWKAFGIKNGARSLEDMRQRIGRYRNEVLRGQDSVVGCRIVVQPTFFPKELWVPQPKSWSPSIVVGKVYDTDQREGLALWQRMQQVSRAVNPALDERFVLEARSQFIAKGQRYGQPQLVKPRLGQGAFRIAVLEAYQRQCGLTDGRVLPALDAAHIRSFGDGGQHEVSNGLLLRKDIHSVFDAGYATFDEDLRFVVSDRVKTEFNNGSEYLRLHGTHLRTPENPYHKPDPKQIEWHRETRFIA